MKSLLWQGVGDLIGIVLYLENNIILAGFLDTDLA